MSTQGLFMMVVTEGIITAITAYFFWKVLTTPPKSETMGQGDNSGQ